MNYQLLALWLVLFILILLSGFFSCSETAMMSLNRYRLRSRVRQGDLRAKRVAELLRRPDRLLGVILLGNTFANILASAVATLLAVQYLGELGLIFSTVVLTVVILIFAETAPKTLAALHPERVAFPLSRILSVLLKVFTPLVWLVTFVANGVLALFRITVPSSVAEALSFDEFRALVNDSGSSISRGYQNMLLRVLDLEKVTLEHVMVPLDDVYAICLLSDWDAVVERIVSSSHAYIPVFSSSLNIIEGVLNVREALRCIVNGEFDLSVLTRLMSSPYFVPGGADLTQQLVHFRKNKMHLAVVIDEYGDVQGVVSMNDILEEVVGEFTDVPTVESLVSFQKDGSVLVDGAANVLDLNRSQHWNLPIDGAKTLSGILIEYLEMIPEEGLGVRVAGYPIEIVSVESNKVTLVKVWPDLYHIIASS